MTTDNDVKYDAFEQEIRVGDWVGYATIDNNYHRSIKGQVVEIGEQIRVEIDSASGFDYDEFIEDQDGVYTWLDARHTIRTLEYFPDPVHQIGRAVMENPPLTVVVRDNYNEVKRIVQQINFSQRWMQ